MQYEVKADLIEAAFLCLNAKEHRYYLHGIYFDGPRIAATDGHRAFVGDTSRHMGEKFIVPYDTLKAAMPVIKKADTVLVEKYHEEYVMIVGANRYVFTPVDGTFPDYARLIPQAIKESPTQFKPSYINDLGKMAKALTGSDTGFHLFQAGLNPAGVKFKGRDDCLSVLMPRRPHECLTW